MVNFVCFGFEATVSMQILGRSQSEFRAQLATVLFVGACMVSIFATSAYGATVIARNQAKAIETSLVGKWMADVGRDKLELSLGSDGQFSLKGDKGEYAVQGNTIVLRAEDGESSYQFDLTADVLTISGGDLAQPAKFTRQIEVGGYLLFHVLTRAPRFIRLSPHSSF